MKLVVRVVEARNLLAMDLNGFSDPYVRLQIGKHNFKTKVVYKCLDPKWDEEFTCWVDDLTTDITICLYDEDKYSADDFLGQVKIPISTVFDAEDKSLDTSWYSLQSKSKKSKNKDCGEICLNIFLSQSGSTLSSGRSTANEKGESSPTHSSMSFVASEKVESFSTPPTLKSSVNDKVESSPSTPSIGTPRSYSPFLDTLQSEVGMSESEDQAANGKFDAVMQLMESRGQEVEVPSNLSGGVLLDQLYLIAPSDLNALLFSPDSKLPHDVANVQGKTELHFEQWKFEDETNILKRVATYINPASKLIKAVKAIEEQTYLKADSKAFAVFSTVSTPDVPYGSCFRVELLYCITCGPEVQSGEKSSNLVISWRLNFLQSTMMKGMIENGARQGLKMSFDQYATCLSENVNCVDINDVSSTKEQILALVEPEPQSDWKLAFQYFANLTVVSTVIIVLFVIGHIWLARSATRGLEFAWLDLPDSIVEVTICGLLFFQVQRVLKLAVKFIQARKRSGSDHGIKAQGDGWLLTVALIEGTNLPAVDATGSSDPYVVFTCHGKKRTSSIKFQKLEPRWNERFEFDAMDEPPSMLHIEVFDSDGPFGDAVSLGHAEINFLRTNITDLTDAWIPLNGKLSQAVQSKLHLRIFLDDNRLGNGVKDYIAKMEKEVGKKINMRSPQTNSAFQKLFNLPGEEFLINDFSCQLKLKGKMPLQGRLFLSPRIIGFNANIFGQKTTFYILLVDIEDIQVAAATFSSMGSQVIAIILRKGRGQDARHGAYTEDREGRLKFQFQSFVSFSSVHKTIMALWKARSLTPPEQEVRIVEEESENKMLDTAESGLFVGIEDVTMSDVYSSTLVIPSNSFMDLFNGGDIEKRVMERIGCLNYTCTPWELGETGMCLRQICYKFGKRISSYTGEVRSTQQKSSLPDKNGVLIEEIMIINGVPYGDFFNLHLRYQAEESPTKPNGCYVKVSYGSEWVKTTSHQRRIAMLISSNLRNLLKVMFAEAEKECANES